MRAENAQPPRLSPREAAAYVMADELARAGLSATMSEFERLGLSERLLDTVNRAGLRLIEKPKPEPEPARPRLIPPSALVTVDDLFPGARVQRYTEPAAGQDQENPDLLEVELPCCRRRVVLPAEDCFEEDVVCQYDRLRFECFLRAEGDGGFGAILTVADSVVVAKPRRRSSR